IASGWTVTWLKVSAVARILTRMVLMNGSASPRGHRGKGLGDAGRRGRGDAQPARGLRRRDLPSAAGIPAWMRDRGLERNKTADLRRPPGSRRKPRLSA